MKVEEGLFLYQRYRYGHIRLFFLWEEHAGDHTNYDSLMKPPKMKEYTSVSYRELDGGGIARNIASPIRGARILS